MSQIMLQKCHNMCYKSVTNMSQNVLQSVTNMSQKCHKTRHKVSQIHVTKSVTKTWLGASLEPVAMAWLGFPHMASVRGGSGLALAYTWLGFGLSRLGAKAVATLNYHIISLVHFQIMISQQLIISVQPCPIISLLPCPIIIISLVSNQLYHYTPVQSYH
jgi:hypothetical protein